ncbi:MAG: acyl-CoA dehydrogenase family protein [Burkholderiaceae bacterium]|nr:acyl-CoA dehydrogenase family protein [Burkholderiaceae bacterium]
MAVTRLTRFALSADDEAVLEAADRFARKGPAPLSRRIDDEECWPPEAFGRIGAAGFLGVTVSPQYGGAGLNLF